MSQQGQATSTHGPIAAWRALVARVGSRRRALAIETERLRSEVEEAEQRLRTVLGSLAEAITIRDRDGSIVYANDAALRSMGFASLQELRARPANTIIKDYLVTGEDGAEITMDELPSVRLLRDEQPDPLLIRTIDRTTGAEHWKILKATPLHDRAGRLEAALTIIEDVTPTKRAERRGSFLARASEILASSLDYEETLRNVAWLAVPEIADWCAVDLIDEGGRRQTVVAAHTEPAKVALAERLREFEPEQVDPRQGIGEVAASGISQLYPDIPDVLLEQAAADDEHLRLLRELGMRSVLIVPMRVGARALGTMTLVTAESGRRFTDDDRQFAEQLAARAAVAVENARLYTQRSEIATTLQRSLLPTTLPRIDGWALATLYRPAGAGAHVEVGGDFYDAFETDHGWLVLIGDVTGKGVEAAAMTSLVRNGARFLAEDLFEPARILARLDATLRQQPALSICSALCLRLDGDRVSMSSAGHPLPLLITDDGVRDVGATGPVLGAFDNCEWPTHTLVLERDELLLLYTDGVTDTVGREGRFGEQRLRQTMAECGPLAPAELLARLDAALARFQVGAQADDTAALALRPARAPAQLRIEHDESHGRSAAAQPPRGGGFDS